MNIELLNPFGQDFPESVGSTLEDCALCARFNSTGRFVAAGRSDGWVTVWDLETKGVLRSLEGHPKAITSISWSRNSKYLLSTSRDWNCVVWDLASGDRRETIRFDAPVVGATFHPKNSKLVLATLVTHQTFLVDLRSDRVQRSELFDVVPAEPSGNDMEEVVPRDSSSGRPKPTMTVARFSPNGKNIYVGTSQGIILAFNARTKQLQNRIKVTNNSSVKHMEFDRSGKYVATNSNDRVVRIFQVNEATQTLELLHRIQDMVGRTPWNGISWSGDGEYVIAGAAHKAAHTIYVWDKESGNLQRILEGPKEPLVDVHWHPQRPVIASVTTSGLIHIWSTSTAENWSAFAPGFEELEENVEYVEREDEFDIEDEDEILRRKRIEEDFDVDIGSGDERDGPPSKAPGRSGASAGEVDDAWAAEGGDDDDEEDFFPPVVLEDFLEEEDVF